MMITLVLMMILMTYDVEVAVDAGDTDDDIC